MPDNQIRNTPSAVMDVDARRQQCTCSNGGHADGRPSRGDRRSVAKAGLGHQVIETGRVREGVQAFLGIHTLLGNIKRLILRTHHGVSHKPVDEDLAEFTYGADRRWLETTRFARLGVVALDGKAGTYKESNTGAT